jgi:hypothetical protein
LQCHIKSTIGSHVVHVVCGFPGPLNDTIAPTLNCFDLVDLAMERLGVNTNDLQVDEATEHSSENEAVHARVFHASLEVFQHRLVALAGHVDKTTNPLATYDNLAHESGQTRGTRNL